MAKPLAHRSQDLVGNRGLLSGQKSVFTACSRHYSSPPRISLIAVLFVHHQTIIRNIPLPFGTAISAFDLFTHGLDLRGLLVDFEAEAGFQKIACWAG